MTLDSVQSQEEGEVSIRYDSYLTECLKRLITAKIRSIAFKGKLAIWRRFRFIRFKVGSGNPINSKRTIIRILFEYADVKNEVIAMRIS